MPFPLDDFNLLNIFVSSDPEIPHNFGEDFRLSIFYPKQFKTLWDNFKISPADLLISLTEFEFNGFENPACSQSTFYTSSDGEYFVKSVRTEKSTFIASWLEPEIEEDFFLNRQNGKELYWTESERKKRHRFSGGMVDYFKYFNDNHHSLLPRFYALFQFEVVSKN